MILYPYERKREAPNNALLYCPQTAQIYDNTGGNRKHNIIINYNVKSISGSVLKIIPPNQFIVRKKIRALLRYII